MTELSVERMFRVPCSAQLLPWSLNSRTGFIREGQMAARSCHGVAIRHVRCFQFSPHRKPSVS
jgi:hypothetical protein